MTWIVLAFMSLILPVLPAYLFVRNLRAYRPPPRPEPGAAVPAISLLIPARDEAASIGQAVTAALASRDVTLEVIVLDDHSRDATARIVAEIARADSRVTLRTAPALPPGWCGKQHACAVLAKLARHPLLVFLDADVRLAPDGLARLAAFLDASRADLVSGVPHQETGGWLERLVIPLIHFVLLGFLPLARMRASTRPALSAGCGQLFMARRDAYESMGGHASIRASLHDGLTLPRAFRAAGLRTDLCDATEVATCRMYRSPRDLWNGLAKNAGEALARPAMIVPATLVLLGGQVLPVALLAMAAWLPREALALTISAVLASYLPRLIAAVKFRQSLTGVLLHPAGVLILVAIQWYALVRDALGHPATWKGRPYPAHSTAAPSVTAGS
jgi:hypothetical protein